MLKIENGKAVIVLAEHTSAEEMMYKMKALIHMIQSAESTIFAQGDLFYAMGLMEDLLPDIDMISKIERNQLNEQ